MSSENKQYEREGNLETPGMTRMPEVRKKK
jgi:hypothetical protein